MPTRLLIIALDSAEPLLAKKWADEGVLPNIAKIQACNHNVAIENFPGFGNGVFWPSVNTGVDPSYHGRYFKYQVTPPSYALEPFLEDRDMKVPPFWVGLEKDGYQVAIVDPVETGMGFLSKGVEIVRWMAHGRTGAPGSSPADVVQHFVEKYGDDPFGGNADAAVKDGLDLDALSKLSQQRIAYKTDAMFDLLNERDWDLFFVTYADAHDVGHLSWHLHEGMEAKGSVSPPSDDPLKLCYETLDSRIAELMASVGPEGQTIIVLGPGMEPNVGANTLLPGILRRLQGRQGRNIAELLAASARLATRSTSFPKALRGKARKLKAKARSKVLATSGQPFYSVPHNDNAGAVRLNVVGREPHGVVQPGTAYDELCAEISEELLDIKDATGKVSLVKQVVKVHDEYSGPEIETLPDLMVIWNRDADVSSVSSPRIGTINNPEDKVRSGDHSVRGLVLSDQPMVKDPGRPLRPSEVTSIFVDALKRVDSHRG